VGTDAGISLVYFFDLLVKTLRVYFLEIAAKSRCADVVAYFRAYPWHSHGAPAGVGGSFISQLREFESVRNFITSSTVVALIDCPSQLYFCNHSLCRWWLVLCVLIAPLMVAYGFFMQRHCVGRSKGLSRG